MRAEYDVVVVGAGPAGSTAARYAVKSGASVLMIEKRQEIGSPVRCGEGIARGLFKKVDIPVDHRWIAREIDGARIISPAGHAFEVDESKAGSEVGFVVERDIFDLTLARMAAKAGVDIAVKTSAVAVLREGGKVTGVKVRQNGEEKNIKAKLVIGADGYESQIGRWAGIDTNVKPSDIMSCVQYRLTGIDIDSKFTEFYIGSAAPGGYIWVFPKDEDTANVGIGMQGSILKKPGEVKYYLDKWIANNPKISKGKQLDMVAGGVSVCAPLDTVTADGILLVGDAARQIDPMTGGGIANSCIAAKVAGEVAGQAVKEKNFSKAFLQNYEKGWRAELEEHLFRNWMAKEKAMQLSDDTFDKLISLLAEVGMENINVVNILKAIQTRYPELVKEFEDLL